MSVNRSAVTQVVANIVVAMESSVTRWATSCTGSVSDSTTAEMLRRNKFAELKNSEQKERTFQ